MKVIALFLLCLFSICAHAQTKTPNEQEAREYFAKKPEITSSSTYFEGDAFFNLYSLKKTGDIVINSNEIHKVIGPKLESFYNCSMIFFDNRMQPTAEIESVQKTIMANYVSGFTFRELAEQYSDPLHHTEEAMIDSEDLPDCPLKTGLEQHNPKEMFFVEASEYISYLIIINDFPVTRKGIIVQHAVYE